MIPLLYSTFAVTKCSPFARTSVILPLSGCTYGLEPYSVISIFAPTSPNLPHEKRCHGMNEVMFAFTWTLIVSLDVGADFTTSTCPLLTPVIRLEPPARSANKQLYNIVVSNLLGIWAHRRPCVGWQAHNPVVDDLSLSFNFIQP